MMSQGMVDAGETVSVTLRREFGEEAMNSLDAPKKDQKKIEKAVKDLFKHGIEVFNQILCTYLSSDYSFWFVPTSCDCYVRRPGITHFGAWSKPNFGGHQSQ